MDRSYNMNLLAARKAKDDEFYTRLDDIIAELSRPDYARHFRGKTVYLNCDHPHRSAFWAFFMSVFHEWGLGRLMATCCEPGGAAFLYEFRPGAGYTVRPIAGDGDFRSGSCTMLLGQSDIIVTNPPFSLFREYAAQLVAYDKKFLIIGSLNAVTYKEFFPLLKDNKVWIGYGHPKEFVRPDGMLESFGNIVWYTNLDIDKRHGPLDLSGNTYHGHEADYPGYVNYDAIECGRVGRIPGDYDGKIGVPITFLEKHCPDQFEIIGISRGLGRPMSEIAAKGTYEQGGPRFYLGPFPADKNGLIYRRLYDRIVIRRIGG